MAVFSAIISLSDLDGSNGFRIDGVTAFDYSGISVSSAGDVNGDGFDDILVGAWGADPNGSASGSSYVVFGVASGFGDDLDLSSLDGTNGFRIDGVAASDYSGFSVSSAGDVNGDGFGDILVGAYGADPNGSASGSSYVVFGVATGFAASLALSDLDGTNGFRIDGVAASDRSGRSLSSAGDVNGDGFDDILVGAPYADLNGSSSGSSYVVFGTASGFAASLALSSLDGSNGFRIDGVTASDYSGWSVSSAGDINGDGFDDILVGAWGADPNGSNSGSSYIVFGAASGFAASFALSDLDGSNGFRIDGVAASDFSGTSVSSAGDVNGDGFDDILVGARNADPNGSASGSSYVVFGAASGFGSTFDLSSLDGVNGFRIDGVAAVDTSGYSVSSAGDVNGDGFDDILVGARNADPNGSASGSSYVVFGAASGFAASLALSSLNGSNGFRIDGVTAYDFSGFSVSSAGDVNGDGFDDIAIGARGADPNGIFSGSSYVVFGKGPGDFPAVFDLAVLGAASGTIIKGVAANDYSGQSVSSAGDVNGDGFDDILVGAWGADPNGDRSGSSYVVFGAASGFAASLALSDLDGSNGFRINGVAADDYSGLSVSSAGDVNGDGFDDILVGARGADPNGSQSGSSYVVFGAASGFAAALALSNLDGSNGFRIDGVSAADLSSRALSSAGDVNGDGFDDIMIGAYGADPNGFGSGSSYVVFGAASGFAATFGLSSLDGSNGFRIDGVAIEDQSGRSVSSAGDVNGDNFDDILIGAFGANANGHYSGASYVVFGAASGFAATFDLSSLDGANGFRIDGVAASDYSGRSVSSAGDVNGDGFDDILIGARGADPNGDRSGSSYVVFGAASGFAASLALSNLDGANGFRIDGVAELDFSGWSVSSAGDVNGDGFDDILIGAFGADPSGNSSGSSYVVFGAASGFAAELSLSNLDGTNGFRIDGVSAQDQSGRSVSSAGDVNGDGFDDILVGAQGADPNGSYSGETYLIYGRAPHQAVTRIGATGDQIIRGGAFDDTLDGQGGDDELFGAGGDDTLLGSTGDDILRGQAGDDTLNGQGNDDRLFGAAGMDTLNGGNGNDILNGGNDNDILNGGAGNDTLNGDDGNDALNGGAGIDTLNGGSGVDTLIGEDGDDILNGGAGNDTLNGNDGNDDLSGGTGDDILSGDAGNDTLNGQGNDDRLFGAAGMDILIGGNGHDILNGGNDNDTLNGGAGNDTLNGDDGNDELSGGADDDTLSGGLGNDQLSGGSGDDTLTGGEGTDELSGGAGNDTLFGGNEADVLIGGADNDTIEGGIGGDVIIGGGGLDNIIGQGGSDDIFGGADDDTISAGNAADTVSGGKGNDTINGNDGADTIFGGSGDDIINAGKAPDTVAGQDGNDTINGNSESDVLLGGKGNDIINGGTGNDILNGQGDDDILNGQQGNDILTGGQGNDIFVFTSTGGDDIITDMVSGAGVVDRIDVSSQNFANFAQVMATASQVGGDVVFSIGAGTLTVKNHVLSDFVANDFIL